MFEEILEKVTTAKKQVYGKLNLDKLESWNEQSLLSLIMKRKIVNKAELEEVVVEQKDGDVPYFVFESDNVEYLIGRSKTFNEENLYDMKKLANCRFYINSKFDPKDTTNIENDPTTYTGQRTICFGNPNEINVIARKAVTNSQKKAPEPAAP